VQVRADTFDRRFVIALLALSTLGPASLAGCGGVVSSTAEAAAVSPSTIALSPPSPPPTTVPAPVITIPPAALPPPEPLRIAATPLDVPLVAVGTQDGEETERIQQRLLDLGFWLQSVNGDYGVTTSQAVMAFQKYMGLPATAEVDEATASLLTVADMRANGTATGGTLIEVDKDRQLLFVIRDGMTTWTINVSTGSGIPFRERDKTEWGKWIHGDAQTPDGIFLVDREREKGWPGGDLGDIYRPKFFNGGIALHGSYEIPNYPASHGCVRMSTAAMDMIWKDDIAPIGMTVWVHSSTPPA
jgi:peptidoglycan hydrolase-like protein with peptidoglycan-binding domain